MTHFLLRLNAAKPCSITQRKGASGSIGSMLPRLADAEVRLQQMSQLGLAAVYRYLVLLLL